MDRQGDSEAVAAVRAGDTERFGELVERHQRLVYGIAWSRLGDRHLCDDALRRARLLPAAGRQRSGLLVVARGQMERQLAGDGFRRR